MQKEKYLQCCFGACPRVGCNKQRVLPVGLSDELRTHRVRVYCTKCQECYEARGKYTRHTCITLPFALFSLLKGTGIDGAFFGTSFPAIFLQTYPSFVCLSLLLVNFLLLFGAMFLYSSFTLLLRAIGFFRNPSAIFPQNFWI